MTTRPNLDDLTRLADAATDGPWVVGGWSDYGEEPRRTLASLNGYEIERLNIATTADAEFIAAARTAVPALTAALRAVLALHRPEWVCGNPGHTNPAHLCPDCAEVCCTCDQALPCPTVQAITEHVEVDR